MQFCGNVSLYVRVTTGFYVFVCINACVFNSIRVYVVCVQGMGYYFRKYSMHANSCKDYNFKIQATLEIINYG